MAKSLKLGDSSWAFWVDRGGTFTDIVAREPGGQLHTKKLLSESPEGKDAAVEGVKQILAMHNCSLADLGDLRMGTTIGTNALLERNGAPLVFVCTKGFADSLKIAYQHRPNIFALEIILPEMLYQTVVEFDERLDAQGAILRSPDLQQLKKDLARVYESGIRSCAIALMHAYKYPQHEKIAAEIARELGFTQISTSHDSAALMKYVSRADTTLVDAYLTPLLQEYIDGLRQELGQTRLQFMQSNGGLAEASLFRGKDSILSGPAGGLVGAIKAAKSCGFDKLISFDMGGTSTDVSHFSGELDIEYIYDAEISGLRIRAPMMDIHTVAAGGGSILSFDGSRYRVGPDSAGANPGPLSYRRKGRLAVTDANVLLGRIQTEYFPKVFGEGMNQELDRAAVERAFCELALKIGKTNKNKVTSPEDVAYGFVKIAVAKMANAIKHVSVQRGHDVRDCVLICFGGAGAQHACLIAEELGINNILIHPLAGLLSAYGIGLAESRLIKDVDINQDLASLDKPELDQMLEQIRNELSNLMEGKGVAKEKQQLRINAQIFMDGSDYSLSVAYADQASMAFAFTEKHLKRYGFSDSKRKLILGSLSLQILGLDSSTENLKMPSPSQQLLREDDTVRFFSGGNWQNAKLVQRHRLKLGEQLYGPALICEDNTTTVLDPGWQAELLADESLLLTAVKRAASLLLPAGSDNDTALLQPTAARGASCAPLDDVPGTIDQDPITLELFNNLFRFVAEQMGITLQNTSHSVNIKERLDFSCALFDAEGNLVANAPHIPVHLGSMGESVKSLLASQGESMKAGDAYATNDPYNGGTHLPDITVISPCFDKSGKRILFFLASRGHHADIGGITPGSMPADSHSIDEEGILFQHMLVMREQKVLTDEIESHLANSKYPARKPAQNLADLKAQIAANTRGAKQMQELIQKWGEETVLAYMGFVQDNAESCVRKAIQTLDSGSFACRMDDGSSIAVSIQINKKDSSALIDFSQTSIQTESNFNSPFAVCKAAVLYVFRTLVPDEIPLNAGCFRPLKLIVPEGCLLNPRYPAPVVAGNVETSQVIVDVLYAALGIMAASQGTMNNLSFGNERYQYYETICGGTGAGASFDGAGPVQSNMTNSRLTDPEVLETRFPVLLESFEIRKGSGGKGLHKGGDGAIRRIRFLEEMTASILSNRRDTIPHGLNGGSPGSAGQNSCLSHGKTVQRQLPFRTSFDLKAGDCLTIKTPGGGGFGEELP